jgi:hypothetical protein
MSLIRSKEVGCNFLQVNPSVTKSVEIRQCRLLQVVSSTVTDGMRREP